MSENILITVVMPVYGHEPHISEALKSLERQTYGRFETVVVTENASDETSNDLARSNLDLTQINYCGDGGLAGALNEGIRHSSGKYIARMDADDICRQNRLQIQVEFMENNDDIDVLGGAYNTISEDGSFRSEVFPPRSHLTIEWCLILNNCIPHPAVMVRRKILTSLDTVYKPKYNTVEDYELWNRLKNSVRIHNLSDKLINYRSSSKSKQYAKRQSELAFGITLREIEKLVGKNHFSDQRINDMRMLINRSDHVKNKEQAVIDILDLFSSFKNKNSRRINPKIEKELNNEMTTRVAMGIIKTQSELKDVKNLTKLLKVNPLLPIYIVKKLTKCAHRYTNKQ